MRTLPTIRTAVLGLALTGLTVSAQTTPPAATPPPRPTPPPVTAPATPTVSPTAVAATVNGETIYELRVQRSLERVPPARRAEVRGTVIDHLVNNLLIDQSLRAAGYKVEPAEVEKRIADMKTE